MLLWHAFLIIMMMMLLLLLMMMMIISAATIDYFISRVVVDYSVD